MKVLKNIKSIVKMDNKGQVFDNVAALMVGLATLAITAVVVFLLMSQTKANSSVAADANATAAISTLQSAGDDVVNFVPLIVIAAIGAVLLGLVALFRSRQ